MPIDDHALFSLLCGTFGLRDLNSYRKSIIKIGLTLTLSYLSFSINTLVLCSMHINTVGVVHLFLSMLTD